MTRALVVGVCASAVLYAAACRHAPREADTTLADLERGFLALRTGDHERAREALARAVATFDDLALDGSDLERAFASDPGKPYRGRPHERVLAALVLAALDIEAQRCDLALPALRHARYLEARATRDAAAELPLLDTLERACAPDPAPLMLELRGHGPSFTARGAYAEALTITPGEGDALVGRIVVVPPGAGRTLDVDGRTEVWSSTFKATHIGRRPFDEVLAERAAFKSKTDAQGRALLAEGQRRLSEGAVGGDRRALVGAAVAGGAAAAFMGASAVPDARVDVRFVRALPERVALVQ